MALLVRVQQQVLRQVTLVLVYTLLVVCTVQERLQRALQVVARVHTRVEVARQEQR